MIPVLHGSSVIQHFKHSDTTETDNLWFLHVPGASCLMYLKCSSEASFEGIWLGKVDGEATVNGSMDVLHGKQEAGFSACTVTR